MNVSILKGISFGFTSSIITALGMMVGIYVSTGSQIAVIGSIFLIAVADSLSDSLGIHISEESDKTKPHSQVWESTFATFFSKLFLTCTFLIPIFFLSLQDAIIAGSIWGIIILSALSYFIAKTKKENPAQVIGEHLLIATIVIIASYFIGVWVAATFN